MSFLDQLTPTQRTAVYVGVPVVGLAVLWQLRGAGAAEEPPPDDTVADPTGTISGYDMPTTDAIGTGTLAGWSERYTEYLSLISGRLEELEKRPTTTPTTPAATGNPKAPHLQGSALGKRRTTVKAHQPAGRGFPGQTPGELARDLYGDRGYYNHIRFFNPSVWPGSPDRAIKAGTVIAY